MGLRPPAKIRKIDLDEPDDKSNGSNSSTGVPPAATAETDVSKSIPSDVSCQIIKEIIQWTFAF